MFPYSFFPYVPYISIDFLVFLFPFYHQELWHRSRMASSGSAYPEAGHRRGDVGTKRGNGNYILLYIYNYILLLHIYI